MRRYELMRQWHHGFIAGIGIGADANDKSKSEHWHAGYLAGYEMRKEKHKAMDEYLISIGREPQAVITIQQSEGPTQ